MEIATVLSQAQPGGQRQSSGRVERGVARTCVSSRPVSTGAFQAHGGLRHEGASEPSPDLLSPPEWLLKLDRHYELVTDSYTWEQQARHYEAEVQAEIDAWQAHDLEMSSAELSRELVDGVAANSVTTTVGGKHTTDSSADDQCESVLGRSGTYGQEYFHEMLASAAPGKDLGITLALIDARSLSDYELVDYVAACARQESWLYARKLDAVAELSARPAMQPEWPATAGSVSEPNVVVEELAMRLPCSRQAAKQLVSMAKAFDGPLDDTGRALLRGQLSVANAQVMFNQLQHASVESAQLIQDRVLPDVTRRTPTQLRRDIERASIEVDAIDYAARSAAARNDRRVDRPRLIGNGMAYWGAVLPVADALMVDTTLDRDARRLRNQGDPRTLDQLRADLLVSKLLDTAPGTLPLSNGPSSSGVRRADGGAQRRPNGAQCADGGVQRGPNGAQCADGGVQRGPNAALRTLNDAEPAQGAFQPAKDRVEIGSESAVQPGTSGEAQAPSHITTRALIHVTVPLSTLLGTSEQAGEVAGFGPIDPTTARALAAGGVWQRLVTDPVTNTVLNVGRTTYRPPAALADHVRARDKQCVRPGCSTPANSAELDHTIEFHRHHGETSDSNLGPLCRRDHQIKTDGGHRLIQYEPGRFQWHTPTGHIYVSEPGNEARHIHLDRDSAQELAMGGGTNRIGVRLAQHLFDKDTSPPF